MAYTISLGGEVGQPAPARLLPRFTGHRKYLSARRQLDAPGRRQQADIDPSRPKLD